MGLRNGPFAVGCQPPTPLIVARYGRGPERWRRCIAGSGAGGWLAPTAPAVHVCCAAPTQHTLPRLPLCRRSRGTSASTWPPSAVAQRRSHLSRGGGGSSSLGGQQRQPLEQRIRLRTSPQAQCLRAARHCWTTLPTMAGVRPLASHTNNSCNSCRLRPTYSASPMRGRLLPS